MTTQIGTHAKSLSPLPSSVTEAAATLARHAHNPSAFLALNAETERFTVPGIDGLIAFRHLFTGGASPVARRQIFDASRRAAIVEAAPSPA